MRRSGDPLADLLNEPDMTDYDPLDEAEALDEELWDDTGSLEYNVDLFEAMNQLEDSSDDEDDEEYDEDDEDEEDEDDEEDEPEDADE